MEDLVLVNTVIIYTAVAAGITNIALLLVLIRFYWNSYKELESKFTIGLLGFTGILLIQNILVTLALCVLLFLGKELNQFDGVEVYSVLLLVNAAQLVALIILSKITGD